MSSIEAGLLWGFLIYAAVCSGSYLLLNMIAFDTLRSYLRHKRTQEDESMYTGLEPPITVIVPAYNEGTTIVSSLQSILQLSYPRLEVVVVNDGSTDNTLDVLLSEFEFEAFPEAVRMSIPCAPIKQVYLSRRLNKLRLIDKDNGGKADAINAGINICRSPLFCCIDADSVLEPASLIRVVQPFLNHPDTIASGGTVRIANGCTVKQGHIIRKGIPTNVLALFQMVEYLRAFLFGRIGWSRIKGLMIISGAFGLFRKDIVVLAGGYATDTIGEDMELILRMYRTMINHHRPYRVAFTPDPVCWTEAPESLGVFGSQRRRWHRGLSESLTLNRDLLFGRGSGTVGWLAFPFFILFEWISPFVELAGYLFTAYLVSTGRMSMIDAGMILSFTVLLSVFLSVVSLLLDEITFPGSISMKDLLVLTLFAFLECFGYRQLNMYYKIQGTIEWAANTKHKWGDMQRSGAWQK
jgi:cellulose synthase/poly-beta-1,6-N-acetylglucosamine synthase-like glycosyltransferase